jgi:hypothetical protein
VERLARTDLNIQIHVGPAKIRQSRTMQVNSEGVPYEGEAMLIPESPAQAKWQRLREWGPNLLLPLPEVMDASKLGRSKKT